MESALLNSDLVAFTCAPKSDVYLINVTTV